MGPKLHPIHKQSLDLTNHYTSELHGSKHIQLNMTNTFSACCTFPSCSLLGVGGAIASKGLHTHHFMAFLRMGPGYQ